MKRSAALILLAYLSLSAGGASAQSLPQDSGQYYIKANFKTLHLISGGRYKSELVSPPDLMSNPNKYMLRVDAKSPVQIYAKQIHQWPGMYFEASFKGSEVYAKLDDGVNILRLSVDKEPPVILNKPGNIEYRIAGLKAGAHTIRLEKLTESQSATAVFEGFFVPPSEQDLLAEAHHRQIEFIGDSYTVGYGNTSPKRDCTTDEVWATTDTSQAFGPITAKAFSADYQINAFSGRGIVKNYDGLAGDTLPQLYPYTLFNGITPYNDENWKPQIVVIGLGTNDFSTPLKPDQKWKTRDDLHADYETTYVAFVKSLRAKNPDAYFILWAADNVEGETLAEVTKVEALLKASGETRLSLLPVPGLSFGGCHAHPNLADDKVIARLLSDFINAHPDLWQGK